MSFVEVNAKDFETFLEIKGFIRTIQKNEIVYVKPMEFNRSLFCKVYTSLSDGNAVARECGADAIRVCCVFENGEKHFGIGKFARVYRTGSQEAVFNRTQERIQAAFDRASAWNEQNKPSVPVDIKNEYFDAKLGETVRRVMNIVDRKTWNDRFIFTMNDVAKRVFVYFSDRDVLEVGKIYDIKFEISGFKTFRGINQTMITNCRGKKIG